MGSLKGLRARYLGSFDAKIAELRDSLARMAKPDDPTARPEIRRRLHTLAGSGEVYGLPDISSWARDVLQILDAAPGSTPADPGLVSDLEGRIDVLEALVTGLRGDVLSDEGSSSHPPELSKVKRFPSEPPPDPDAPPPPSTLSSSAASGLSFAAPISIPPGAEDWRVAVPERKGTTKPIIELADDSAAARLPRLPDEDFVAEASGPFVLPKLPEDDLQPAEPSSPNLAISMPPPPPAAATLVSMPAPDEKHKTRLGVTSPAALAAVVETARLSADPPTPQQALAATLQMPVAPAPATTPPVRTLQMVASKPDLKKAEPPKAEPSPAKKSGTLLMATFPLPAAPTDDEDTDEDAILPASTMPGDSVAAVLPTAVPAADSAPATPFTPIPGVGEAEFTVLVVDDDPTVHEDIRAALDLRRFRVFTTASPAEAMDLARQEAPDLVILDAGMPGDGGFALFDRMRQDPLTSFLSVLFLAAQGELTGRTRAFVGGALEYLAKPFDKKDLAKKIERHCAHTPVVQDLPDLGEASLEEVVHFIEREVRRGLLESAEGADRARIVLGQGAELLATTWNVVGRLREIVARLSSGGVRFRAVDHGRLGVLSLHADEHLSVVPPAPSGPVLDLGGRRVLVVDDDPAVRSFFASVLEEVGAKVDRAEDGKQALNRARAVRPDVVVSDILMPEMDGWELCRALRRDFTLRDVPVVLLSWKEDFVQRMKELDARADAYLLKESQKPAILERFRSVLRPRMLLEQRLAAGGEVSGRVDSIGIVTLLGAVCRHRGDAKIRLRENWNLFEVEVRAGVPVSATRTSTDGTLRRGNEAFDELVAVDGGRFTVLPVPSGSVRTNLSGSLEELVAASAARLGELVASVSDAALLRVTGVTFRSEALETYLKVAPERVREIVRRLSAGQPPQTIMESVSVGPQEMERVLVDLVKRGAIHAVLAPTRTETSVTRTLADEQRWKVLAQSDASEMPDIVGERAASIPPPAPAAEPVESHPPIESEARKSLAPEPPVSIRASQAGRSTQSAARTSAWTALIVLTLFGLALWGYIFMTGARQREEETRDQTPATAAAIQPEIATPPPFAPPPPMPQTAAPVSAAVATAVPETSAPVTAAPEEEDRDRSREERRAERRERERERVRDEPENPYVEPREERREKAPARNTGTLAIVAPGGDPVEVIVDDRPRGRTPLQLTLTGGLHEVGLKRGDSPVVFRYVVVREGQEVRLVAPRIP